MIHLRAIDDSAEGLAAQPYSLRNPLGSKAFRRNVEDVCGGDLPRQCPAAPLMWQQMAAFITKTFGLMLYGLAERPDTTTGGSSRSA